MGPRTRRIVTLVVLIALVAVVVVAAVSSTAGATPRADGVSTVCRFTDDRLTEISGMTTSIAHPGVLWVHNDSSGGPYLYAVDGTTCRTLARIRIDGIAARDIEAIASSRDARGRPVLWVADIGDNNDSWPYVWLYRVREPAHLVDQTVSARTYKVTYRDRPYNAEALLVDPTTQRMWIVTKQLIHGRIYALPARLSRTAVNVATPVGQVGGLVTDGAFAPDGSGYVLRDYWDARTYRGSPPGALTDEIVMPAQIQGEAVTFAPGGDALLVASERDDRLLRVPLP